MKIALAPFLALALSGCAWFASPVAQERGTLQFVKGVTTESEVAAKLGQLNVTTWLTDGTVVEIYTFAPAAGGAAAQSRVMTLTFDSHGTLLNYASPSSNPAGQAALTN